MGLAPPDEYSLLSSGAPSLQLPEAYRLDTPDAFSLVQAPPAPQLRGANTNLTVGPRNNTESGTLADSTAHGKRSHGPGHSVMGPASKHAMGADASPILRTLHEREVYFRGNEDRPYANRGRHGNQRNPSRTTAEVLQQLRGRDTKATYTKIMPWRLLLGGPTEIEDENGEEKGRGVLDPSEAQLAGEDVDFGHFIGALSGQDGVQTPLGPVAEFLAFAVGGNLDLPTAVSWAGDLGSAAMDHVAKGEGADITKSIETNAGDADLAANIAAVRVGNQLDFDERRSPEHAASSITVAVQEYDQPVGADGRAIPAGERFQHHVRAFVREDLGGEFSDNGSEPRLLNVVQVAHEITARTMDFVVLQGTYEALEAKVGEIRSQAKEKGVNGSRTDSTKGHGAMPGTPTALTVLPVDPFGAGEATAEVIEAIAAVTKELGNIIPKVKEKYRESIKLTTAHFILYLSREGNFQSSL